MNSSDNVEIKLFDFGYFVVLMRIYWCNFFLVLYVVFIFKKMILLLFFCNLWCFWIKIDQFFIGKVDFVYSR